LIHKPKPSLSPGLYIGLMSGTSLDGVDGVIARIGTDTGLQVLSHASTGLPLELRQELLSLNQRGLNELHRAALAANGLMTCYATVVHELLHISSISPADITAIGAHGQTVRHQPQMHDGTGYTLQLNNPALLAEQTGIDVVADFRSRDVAAGGQGAPLVPAFHQGVFGQAHETVAVLNIGGISNLSLLQPGQAARGWDCGPGNALMDHWCLVHTGQPYDEDGAWATSGQVIEPLLARLLQEDYLRQSPPKSTGRDLFNPAWLQSRLQDFADAPPVNIQATLTAFTAQACIRDIHQHAAHAQRLIVCGGGALNGQLIRLLANGLPGIQVASSEAHGLPPLQVEAAAFAWLAFKCVLREPASMPSVTGAQGARVLGARYPR
jgi:anhydro-N-acetylmuramic acid kinase